MMGARRLDALPVLDAGSMLDSDRSMTGRDAYAEYTDGGGAGCADGVR